MFNYSSVEICKMTEEECILFKEKAGQPMTFFCNENDITLDLYVDENGKTIIESHSPMAEHVMDIMKKHLVPPTNKEDPKGWSRALTKMRLLGSANVIS